MSWFKHSPPKHPPHRSHSHPHRTSPATARMMDEAKETGPTEKKTRRKKSKSE